MITWTAIRSFFSLRAGKIWSEYTIKADCCSKHCWWISHMQNELNPIVWKETNTFVFHLIFRLALVIFSSSKNHLACILYLPKHLKVVNNNTIFNMRKVITISKYQSHQNEHLIFLSCHFDCSSGMLDKNIHCKALPYKC